MRGKRGWWVGGEDLGVIEKRSMIAVMYEEDRP